MTEKEEIEMTDRNQQAMSAVDRAINGHNEVSKANRQILTNNTEEMKKTLAKMRLERRDLDKRIMDVEATISANERALELLPPDHADSESFRPVAGGRSLPVATGLPENRKSDAA